MAGVGMFFITVIMFLLIIAMLITGIILLIVGLASKEKKKGCIITGAILMGLSFIFGIIFYVKNCDVTIFYKNVLDYHIIIFEVFQVK